MHWVSGIIKDKAEDQVKDLGRKQRDWKHEGKIEGHVMSQKAHPFNSGGKEMLEGNKMTEGNFRELKTLDWKWLTSAKQWIGPIPRHIPGKFQNS